MSYLDQYAEQGAIDERRARLLKRTAIVVFAMVVIASVLYYQFKNHREERQVQQFLTDLARGDYAAAYALWGCKVEAPCPNYDFKSFVEDWGPTSPVGKVQTYRVGVSHERGSGVVIGVSLNGQRPVRLWVEK